MIYNLILIEFYWDFASVAANKQKIIFYVKDPLNQTENLYCSARMVENLANQCDCEYSNWCQIYQLIIDKQQFHFENTDFLVIGQFN